MNCAIRLNHKSEIFLRSDEPFQWSLPSILKVFLTSQAQLDEYIRRLEEAERNIKIAETKIAERDQRIIELERLLDCMGKVEQQINKNSD